MMFSTSSFPYLELNSTSREVSASVSSHDRRPRMSDQHYGPATLTPVTEVKREVEIKTEAGVSVSSSPAAAAAGINIAGFSRANGYSQAR